MAKKKTTPPPETETQLNEADQQAALISRICGEITKKHGSVFESGDDFLARKIQAISLSPAFDTLLSGPIQEGSIIGLTGNEKTGKTVTALSFAAQAQKEEYGSRPIFFGSAEARPSQEHMRDIYGLDMRPERFQIIESRQGNILSAQKQLDIYLTILKEVPRAVLIIDSLSALVHDRMLDGGVETELRGATAQMISRFVGIARQYVTANKCIVIGITHLICDTGNPQAGKQEKVARAWKYACDYQLRAISSTDWTATNGDVIGLKVNWLCKTSKNGVRGMKADTFIRFGVGVDSLFELMTFAKATGLIVGTGWQMAKFMKNYPEVFGVEKWDDKLDSKLKAQGDQKMYDLLKSNPAWIELLRQELRNFLEYV